MGPGTMLAERTREAKDGQPAAWRIHVVKRVTQRGVVTLLRADGSTFVESTTTAGFDKAVKANEIDDWRVVCTDAIDILASNAINAGGSVSREGIS